MSPEFPKMKPIQTSFNSELYLKLQCVALLKRMHALKSDVVYLEFGGKIFDDMHAARVLPGYYPDMKVRIIKKFLKNADLIFCVSAKDIERNRLRGDHKITYDKETFRLIEKLKQAGIIIKNISITRTTKENLNNRNVKKFCSALRKKGIDVICQSEVADYTLQKSLKFLEKEPYFKSTKKFVIILSPGGGSGKFGVCLNQLFHEMQNGHVPYYIKFETFPVHDLSVSHPVNLAYMSASADFYDLVVRDPRHLKEASSYNRDVENYELLHLIARHFKKEGKLLRKISSATNMSVNILSQAVKDWETVEKEAAAEISRRFIRHKYEVSRNEEKPEVLERVKNILNILCQENL